MWGPCLWTAVNFTNSSFTFFALILSKQLSSVSKGATGSVGTSDSWPPCPDLILCSVAPVFLPHCPSPHVGVHLLCPGTHLMAHSCSVRKHLQSTWSLLLGNHCREEGTRGFWPGVPPTLIQQKRKDKSRFVHYLLIRSPSSIKPNRWQHSGWFPSCIGYLNERKEEMEREVAGTSMEEGHSPRPDHWVRFGKSDKKGVVQVRGQDRDSDPGKCQLDFPRRGQLTINSKVCFAISTLGSMSALWKDCLKELVSHFLSPLLPAPMPVFPHSRSQTVAMTVCYYSRFYIIIL